MGKEEAPKPITPEHTNPLPPLDPLLEALDRAPIDEPLTDQELRGLNAGFDDLRNHRTRPLEEIFEDIVIPNDTNP